jgi:hypothetical protein
VEPYSNSGPLHPGTCRDNNANCAKWAAIGECERNVVFMKVRRWLWVPDTGAVTASGSSWACACSRRLG